MFSLIRRSDANDSRTRPENRAAVVINLERKTQIEGYLLDENGVSVDRHALPANFSKVLTRKTKNASGIEVKLNDLTNFTASQIADQNGNQFVFLAKTPRYGNSAILDVGWQTHV